VNTLDLARCLSIGLDFEGSSASGACVPEGSAIGDAVGTNGHSEAGDQFGRVGVDPFCLGRTGGEDDPRRLRQQLHQPCRRLDGSQIECTGSAGHEDQICCLHRLAGSRVCMRRRIDHDEGRAGGLRLLDFRQDTRRRAVDHLRRSFLTPKTSKRTLVQIAHSQPRTDGCFRSKNS
jgi:hypothetical protein